MEKKIYIYKIYIMYMCVYIYPLYMAARAVARCVMRMLDVNVMFM